MSNYDNTNKGTLGVNNRREKDSHPQHKGSINIEGKEYWLSGWEKVNQATGEVFISLSATLKEQQQPQQQQRQAPPPQQRAQSYARPQAQQQGAISHGYGKTPPPPPENYEQLSGESAKSSGYPF